MTDLEFDLKAGFIVLLCLLVVLLTGCECKDCGSGPTNPNQNEVTK